MANNKRIGNYVPLTRANQSGFWQEEDLYASNQRTVVQNGLQFYIDPTIPASYSDSTINKFSSPVDIYSFVSTAGTNNCTVSRDTSVISPKGNSPLKMIVTGTDPYIAMYNAAAFNVSAASQGQTWTVSVYVKADAPTTAQLFMMEANSSGGYLGSNATTTSIGTSWTRITNTYTLVNASAAYVQVRLDGPDNGELRTLWWDGLQVEQSSGMTDFRAGPTKAIDLSGNGRNATLVNSPTLTSNAFTFYPGNNSYISCGNFGSFYSQGTIAFWMNPTDVSNYRNPIHSHFQGVNTGFRFEQAGTASDILTSGGGTMGMLFGTDAGSPTGHQFGAVYPDRWYLVTVTWDTSTNTAIGYLNNATSFNESNTTWSTTLPSLTIGGGFSSSPERWYSGGIGPVMLYNRALSYSEVSQNYYAMIPFYSTYNNNIITIKTTNPPAPTIGTVTITNTSTVSIPYTDSGTGGRYVQGHYATVTPLISGTTTTQSNPLTFTGPFVQGTSYTFKVSAYNSNGYSPLSTASNSVIPYPVPPPVTPPVVPPVTPPVTPPVVPPVTPPVTPPVVPPVTPPVVPPVTPPPPVVPPVTPPPPVVPPVTPPVVPPAPPPPVGSCRPPHPYCNCYSSCRTCYIC